jgi:hypothetical protein
LNKPQDVITRFPNLQVLRLTQPPLAVIEEEEEEDDELFRERQWRYHSFAEPIMQCLAEDKGALAEHVCPGSGFAESDAEPCPWDEDRKAYV